MNNYIDHTLLKQDATTEQIKTLCNEAIEYSFKTVCINPTHVAFAKNILKNNNVGICTVIGFPLGASDTSVKEFETKKAIADGATEVDMVINIGALKEGNDDIVTEDIRKVVMAAKEIPVKVIFETCLLNDEQIIRACNLSLKAGATFVKTSTGFSTAGANKEVVDLMLKTVNGKCSVKASGGVRSFSDAKMYIEMGVKRLGTSSGVAIMQGQSSESNY